jgi:hypothetical protein
VFPSTLYPIPVWPGPLFPGAGKGGVAPMTGPVDLYPGPLFPGPLFPASLFPTKAGASPGLAVDLLAAVVARFAASAAAAAVPGGLFAVLPGLTAPLPFATFEEVSSPLGFASSTSKLRRTRIRFRVYADDGDQAAVAGDALEDAFAGARLRFSGGYTGPFVVGDRGHRPEAGAPSDAGNQGWRFLVEFTAMVRRGG